MSREFFQTTKFQAKTIVLIDQANAIIGEYQARGFQPHQTPVWNPGGANGHASPKAVILDAPKRCRKREEAVRKLGERFRMAARSENFCDYPSSVRR
jgi:hypothetical protein